MRKILAALATTTMLVLFSLPAAADTLPCDPAAHGTGPAAGCTVNMHNLSDTFSDFVPCVVPPVAAVITLSKGNLVFHITMLANGTYWVTFTEEGTFSALSAAGVTYVGHFTAWDGEAWNRNNAVFTGTFNINATGSDGSSISGHGLFHLNFDATGMPHATMHFNC